VWFPSDPEQTPASRFLDEVAAAGYEWVEIGPFGYLPSTAAELQDELDAHGLRVSAGTVFSALHRPNSWDAVWQQVTDVAALTRDVGGEHIVVIPDLYRDHKTGADIESRTLSDEQWAALTAGTDELGRRILEEYGLRLQFHSHADSHIGYQHEIERFLESTNPDYVNLCLDTGHVAYYGGDNVGLIRKYPERIGYLHLKQVDPDVVKQVETEDLTFPEAVRRGVMIEPPLGVPDMAQLLGVVEELDRDIYAIVEQDLYPCAPEVPLPIARRTHTYLAGCGVAAIEIGTQKP
jgi:inosose dehydratase